MQYEFHGNWRHSTSIITRGLKKAFAHVMPVIVTDHISLGTEDRQLTFTDFEIKCQQAGRGMLQC